ncbi:MAG: CYTH domain-containing protein [Candidatus Peregrinibacteria bacterium]|nr:CYTH domain-containing protein [Candidatus Peregrinibacteria bacterium]
MRTLLTAVFLCVLTVQSSSLAQPTTGSGDTSAPALPIEERLSVSLESTEEVWAYMLDRYVTNTLFLRGIDAQLTALSSDDVVVDTYFDTPNFVNLKEQNGLRHRKRMSTADGANGSEWVQIRLKSINLHDPLARAEYKFDVVHAKNFSTADDRHPLIGLIAIDQREDFKDSVRETLGIDPYQAVQILTIHQRRRRISIAKDGVALLTVSLDHVGSTFDGTEVVFAEVEVEGDDALTQEADALQEDIVADLQREFPSIKPDLPPKYNKVFARFEEEIPLFRTRVLHGGGANYLAWGTLGVLFLGFLGLFWYFSAKRRSLA